MTMPKLPFSFPDVVRYPLHAVVYLLLIYFVYKEFTKTDECSDLRANSLAQAKRIENLEQKIDQLTWSIAVKSGIINELKSKKDTSNSMNHENSN
jgi:hypothetical protein